jgi:hypothetical protein
VNAPTEVETPEVIMPTETSSSLADRMAKRRSAIERRKTKTLEIPGYEGILEVEYRLLGWQSIRKIQARHEGLTDEGLQQLYSAADTLITAREETYEIPENGGQPRPLGENWIELARRSGATLPENCSQRQAMFLLFVHDMRLMEHYGQYERWARGLDSEVDDEVVSDFEGTA